MIKIKVIIVDDEAPSRRRMGKLLSSIKEINLVGEAENGGDAIQLITNLKPDLLLLDIQLKDMTGFDVLKSIQKDVQCGIIFITAYDQFAVDAFEANALDYLLKPYKDERFHRAISKSIELIRTRNQPSLKDIVLKIKSADDSNTRIKVSEGKMTHFFGLDDIIYIKSESYYCNFHTISASKPKTIRVSLKKMESILPEIFVRLNKSVIVNTKKISATKVMKNVIEIVMEDGSEFMAKRNYNKLDEKMKKFI